MNKRLIAVVWLEGRMIDTEIAMPIIVSVRTSDVVNWIAKNSDIELTEAN